MSPLPALAWLAVVRGWYAWSVMSMVSSAVARAGLVFAAIVGPAVAAADPSDGRCVAVFAQVAPTTAYISDLDEYGPGEEGVLGLGLGGNLSSCRGRLELGVGARYDLELGSSYAGHFFAMPVWIGARSKSADEAALRFVAGLGPAIGVVVGSFWGDAPSTTMYVGPSLELSVGVIHTIAPGSAVMVDAGIRIDVLRKVSNPEFGDDDLLFNAQLPFLRAGMSW